MSILRWLQHGVALSATVLMMPGAHTEERATPPAIVNRTCSGCHGVNGLSQLRYIPRLAGLSAEYLERKLDSFRAAASSPVDEAIRRGTRRAGSGDRTVSAEASVHMVGVAHAISEKDLKTAAQWYAAQPPARGKGGTGQEIELGRSLFAKGLKGNSSQGCQTCHGAEAQGTSIAPRLAGQNAAYVVSQLALFRAENDSRSPMPAVARSIGDDQARAIAQYLQSR